MSGNFKVGEVLIGQNFTIDVEANGMECIVLAAPVYGPVFVLHTGLIEILLTCEVEWADGMIDNVSVSKLRRKQPPSGELSILNMFVVAPTQRTKEMS